MASGMSLVCQADRLGDAVWLTEELPDAADDMALERADRVALGLAALALSGDVERGSPMYCGQRSWLPA